MKAQDFHMPEVGDSFIENGIIYKIIGLTDDEIIFIKGTGVIGYIEEYTVDFYKFSILLNEGLMNGSIKKLFRKVKNTRLARKIYPDAKEKDGWLVVDIRG